MSFVLTLIGLLIVLGIARRFFTAWDKVNQADDWLEQQR